MAHVRQSIRSNVETTLTGLTTTGSRVYASRVYPIQSAGMPGLCIYTSSETIEAQTIKPPRGLIRSLEVSVEAYVENANADDTLDTICAEVEAAMTTDLTRGGYAKDTRLVSFEAEFAGDGERPVVVGRLQFEILYSTSEADAESVY
ncbi:MAG: hypothetical protein VW620_11485 [Rhodospirillales bacterium]